MASLPMSTAGQNSSTKSQERTSPGYSSGTDIQSGKKLGKVEPANKLIGKEVLSSDNQKVGKLENFIIDLDSGRILYALVSSGGVLGAGEKKYAVAPRAFNQPQDDTLLLKVDKAKLQGAPQFTSQIDKNEEMGRASFVKQVHQYFAQNISDRVYTTMPSSTTESKNVFKADDLIGMKVKNSGDTDLGKVDNLAVDLPNGHVVYVILAPDSSLKLGDQYFALPPSALMAAADRKLLTTELTIQKIAGAPRFAKDNWASLSDRTWASHVYQYYGKRAYFDTSSGLEPTGRTEDKSFPRTKD
jgi:sporulation protein YlmC with PRC-barrel domain